SDLTHCLTQSYWDRVDFIPPTDEKALAFARGWLLEDFTIDDIHVEPFEVDGILLSVDAYLGLPIDIKSTLLAPETSSGCSVCGQPLKGHKGLCGCGHQASLHTNGSCVIGLPEAEREWCECESYTPHPYTKGTPKPFEFPVEWQRRFAAYRYGLNR